MATERLETRQAGVASYLAVEDLDRSVDFYKDVLGFQVDMVDNGFALVSRNRVSIMFQRTDTFHRPRLSSWAGYIWVNDVDGSRRELEEKGVTFTDPVADRHWGTREFEVQDLDGHHLRFGQILDITE
ncbi:MAG: VOC family protein [Capsulimonadaceae bacterium]|nr:VOC family protein [Capsulimonadaceae bacterium]